MACPEVEFLTQKARNVIVGVRKREYNVQIPKDDALLKEIKEYFKDRVKAVKEGFRGNVYIVKVKGFDCPEVEFLADKVYNIIIGVAEKKYIAVLERDDEKLEEIRKYFGDRIISYKPGLRGRAYVVEIKI